MSNGGVSVEQDRKRSEYLRWLGLVVLGAMLMFLATRWNPPLRVDTIDVAYPYNERSLIVERNGNAELTLKGKKMEVHHGYFDVDDLFQQLMAHWEPLREGDVEAQPMGTVRIFYNNHTSGTYFIYDTVYLDEVFTDARDNLVDNP